MWTPDALRSETGTYSGVVWRVVEGQARISTMRITDSLLEQRILEEEIEKAKPRFPPGAEHLDPLLRTPFRYEPYDNGSRFRRAHQREGVFYGSEAVETAIAELAFYRLLFVAEAPGMVLPDRSLEFTAFSVNIQAQVLDLTRPPLNSAASQWTDLTDYRACQDLADVARSASVEAIRYQSVRDPNIRANLALLTWRIFTTPDPQILQTWHLFMRPCGVDAMREFPFLTLEFGKTAFGRDRRLESLFSGCD